MYKLISYADEMIKISINRLLIVCLKKIRYYELNSLKNEQTKIN